VDHALVVRSEDSARIIEWNTATVPERLESVDAVAFVLLAGIDANEDCRSFELSIDGRPVLEFQNPAVATEQVLEWIGLHGVRAEFRVTLVDRYADAMGFLFLQVPRSLISPGRPLRLSVRGESAGTRTWFLVFAHEVEPRIAIHPVPAVVRSPDGPLQEVRIDLLRLDEGGPFSMESEAGRVKIDTGFGPSRLSLEVPAVRNPTEVPVAFELAGARYETRIPVDPVEPLTIHLIHHTHLDIGYTHLQEEVEKLQWSHLEQALRIGEESESLSEEARFVWHPEAVWAVETYLEHHSEENVDRLLDGIRRGWIHLDALHTNLLTGIATGEGLIRELEPAQKLAERTGVAIRSAMFTDIPGFAWGWTTVLGEAGVRYLSVGPNRWHRIGRFLSTWADRPFWWESPNGKHRVLVWVHGEGYSLFHTGLGYEQLETRLDADRLLSAIERLRARGWKHPVSALRYNIGSDNGPPDPTLPATVESWNERYETPRLVISSSERALAELENCGGARLPIVRADLNGIWEDGVASTARETQSIRHTAEWLVTAEALAAMRGRPLDAEAVYRAWRELLLSYEHTWGAWNSISEPDAEFVRGQWKRKQEFVRAAAARTDALVKATLADRIETGSAETQGSGRVEILNPLAWARREIVILDRLACGDATEVRDAGGALLPCQRLKDGGLAFQPPTVPGYSSLHLQLQGETTHHTDGAHVRADSGSRIILDNGIVQLGLDPLTGRIESLRRVDGTGPGRNLVPEGEAFAEWFHVAGRDPSMARSAEAGSIEVTDAGPLVWRAVIRRDAPGTTAGLSTVLRLQAGSDRVEIELRFDKLGKFDPEAVLVRFPVAITDSSTRRMVGGAFAPFRADEDQAPGANRNWYTVERWADLHDSAGGIHLVTVDAPLVQFGAPGSDPIVTGWRERVDPQPVLHSYLMNNYWETNYRAAQEGPHSIRYVVRPHAGFDVSAAERCGLEAAHPLLAYRVRPEVEPLSPPVRIESEKSVVSLLRRTSNMIEIRLFNPSNNIDLVTIGFPDTNEIEEREIDPGDVALIQLPLPRDG
jgi:hypothetical protein